MKSAYINRIGDRSSKKQGDAKWKILMEFCIFKKKYLMTIMCKKKIKKKKNQAICVHSKIRSDYNLYFSA